MQQAGLFEVFKTLARYEDQGLRLLDKQAQLLFESNDGSRPEIDRGQLRKMLLRSVPDEAVRWGHALREARPLGEDGFELIFRNGLTGRFDFVVGADGAWSRVRPLVSAARPAYTGLTFFELTIEAADAQRPEVAQLVERGLIIATADRQLLMAQRNASGHVRVYAALRVPEERPEKDGTYPTVAAKTRLDIAAQYEGWEKSLVGLIELAGEKVRPWLIHALPVGHRWPSRDGVTLLGDAAHLMPPAGDGANLAMRDAVDLAHALADPGDWRAAVRRYPRQRDRDVRG